MAEHFTIWARDEGSAARCGRLVTRHGCVDTPIFMPVGTQATVKALTPEQVRGCGAQIILGNTYHLNLRPGPELIRELGGLHRFMGWEHPILTDSGGFQVFSLAANRKLTERGVEFKSHIDGAKFFLGPKECFEIQEALGTDIAMVLDECPPWPCERDAAALANARTLRWAREFKAHAEQAGFLSAGHHVFAIVQGSTFADLRRECAEALAQMDFPGYAIGGVSVGEPEEEMLRQTAASVPYLPLDKPRYVMGVGTPPQLLEMVGQGCDMFDCVMPTRLARHGTAFTPEGTINLKNACHARVDAPLVSGLDNYTARFSRAYLRHLVLTGEFLGHTLLSLHNIHFFLDLMRQAREHIAAGDFASWKTAWINRYRG